MLTPSLAVPPRWTLRPQRLLSLLRPILLVAGASALALIAADVTAVDRPAAASCEPGWRRPVDAEIVDGFRPPAHPYGAGNRGLEYATALGDPVSAVASGRVGFAGPVGRSRFVVIHHRSGLRSTYAYLDEIHTASGQSVDAGQVIATARSGFHLTARSGPTYIDPRPLMADRCFVVRLVAVPARAAPVEGSISGIRSTWPRGRADGPAAQTAEPPDRLGPPGAGDSGP